MLRTILLIVIGLTIGYFLGFGDAQKHDRHVIERLVDRAGSGMRDNVGNDIDARFDRANR